MTFLKLLDYVQKNQGATVEINGLDNYEIKTYTCGYQVALRGFRTGGGRAEELIFDMKKEFNDLIAFFMTKTSGTIGLWLDDGLLYIDTLVLHTYDLAKAYDLAKVNNQKAIFDWSKMDSIYIK